MQSDLDTTLEELKTRIKKFLQDRAWEKYHNPKDLAESICIEAAELLELFQWVSSDETLSWKNVSSKTRRIGEELADVIIYCLSMANTMKIDVSKAVASKLKKNETKYPIEKYRGKARLKDIENGNGASNK